MISNRRRPRSWCPFGARPFASTLAALVTLALLAIARPARAEDPRAEAKADLVAGMALLEKGDHAGALRKFDAAYALVPSPKVQFNRGLALEALGRHVEALGAFDLFLAGATEKREHGERHRRELLAKVAAITITSDVVGVAVSIDGVAQGKTPFPRPIYVEPGKHRLIAVSPGAAPVPQTFAASKGAELTIPVGAAATAMTPAPPAPPAPAATAVAPPVKPAAATPVTAPPTPRAAVNLAPAPPSPPPAPPLVATGDASPAAPSADVVSRSADSSSRGPLKWVSFGLAAASVAIGVREKLVAVQKSKDFNQVANQSCMDDGHGKIGGGKLCEQVAHDQTVATWAAAIAYGLGGGFAVTGVVLQVTQPEPQERRAAVLAVTSCGPGPSLISASCVARW